MGFLSTNQIQAQVLSIRRALKNGPENFAIQYSGEWTGGDYLSVADVDHLVFPCVSDLQVRESLLSAEKQGRPAILLCSMESSDLEDDVIDRFAKRRVFSPRERDMLAELFSVTPEMIDPRLLKTKELMNALLEVVPAKGYSPVAGGMLDLQTAWLTYLGQVSGTKLDSISLNKILEWSRNPEVRKKINQVDPKLKGMLTDWLVRNCGESSRYMMLAMSVMTTDLFALGETLSVVFHEGHFPTAAHQAAKVRSERYFDHQEIDLVSARAWSRSTNAYFKRSDQQEDVAFWIQLGQQVDSQLEELGVAESAWLSDFSSMGLEQRYSAVSKSLKKVLKYESKSGLESLRNSITIVRKHREGGRDMERVSRLEMAYRLVAWLCDSDREDSTDFGGLVNEYHKNGGFVDWARYRLKESDENSQVKKAYDAVLKKVDEREEAYEETFALRLQEWTKASDTSKEFILIENVLDEVVVPLAKLQPVLLLVLDGMSVAVMRQLLVDLTKHGWAEMKTKETEQKVVKPVLATLPSITAVSRRALFLGRLESVTKGSEEGEFRKNESLLQGSKGQIQPRLFKMGELTQEGQSGLSDEVLHTLSNKKCRVVSLVLNAIDDHLDSGKQVSLTWTRDSIRGLREALRQAADAGRAVVFTSDHGHVLDSGSKQFSSEKEGRGDRYRSCSTPLVDGELLYSGNRVQQALGGESVTLAWSDKARYGKGKRGYHGGSNPQEVVVPMTVLTNAVNDPPEGWIEVPSYQPHWWRVSGPEEVAKQSAPAATAVEGLELFEAAPKPMSTVSWVQSLLESPIYEEQTSQAVRGALSADVMSKLLTFLAERGGKGLKPALAQELGVPAFRLDGMIQNVARVLNLDGYEVIEFDRSSGTITLNVDLLKKQFEL